MATQLGTYHGGCTGRGADEAGHGALDEQATRKVGEEDEHRCAEGEGYDLNQQQRGVPAAGLQVGGLYLAEGDKQHAEDECGLQYANQLVGDVAGASEEGKAGVDKVEHYAHEHRDGQRPILIETEDSFQHDRLLVI